MFHGMLSVLQAASSSQMHCPCSMLSPEPHSAIAASRSGDCPPCENTRKQSSRTRERSAAERRPLARVAPPTFTSPLCGPAWGAGCPGRGAAGPLRPLVPCTHRLVHHTGAPAGRPAGRLPLPSRSCPPALPAPAAVLPGPLPVRDCGSGPARRSFGGG